VRITFQPSHSFAGPGFEKIVSTTLPEGTYALYARAELDGDLFDFTSGELDTGCQLRDAANTSFGGARETEDISGQNGIIPEITLNVIGVVSVPAGGKEMSLWCFNAGSTAGSLGPDGADLMAVKVGGTF
jgi:hypothetical protein